MLQSLPLASANGILISTFHLGFSPIYKLFLKLLFSARIAVGFSQRTTDLPIELGFSHIFPVNPSEIFPPNPISYFFIFPIIARIKT
jgi:hypothetical protein